MRRPVSHAAAESQGFLRKEMREKKSMPHIYPAPKQGLDLSNIHKTTSLPTPIFLKGDCVCVFFV